MLDYLGLEVTKYVLVCLAPEEREEEPHQSQSVCRTIGSLLLPGPGVSCLPVRLSENVMIMFITGSGQLCQLSYDDKGGMSPSVVILNHCRQDSDCSELCNTKSTLTMLC